MSGKLTHDPCCSSHGVSLDCETYRRTHFVQIGPCCSVWAKEHPEYGTADEPTRPEADAVADVGPVFEQLTATAEAKLVDTVPMATHDYPYRKFLPEKISVRYVPESDGWQVSSIWIQGRAVLKSGEAGKRPRSAYYVPARGGRPGNLGDCPVWAREFADLHYPKDGAQ